MKKRVLAIMLVCFMLVSLLPMGALAEEVKCPGEGEKHYLGKCDATWVEFVKGVCGEYDYDVYVCNDCGDYFAANFKKVDGECETVVTKAPTCTETGVEKCTICGKEYTIPATGHKPGELEGDCLTGWKSTCTVCGELLEAVAGGHTWGERPSKIVKEPTLDENGLAEYTCTVCGAVKEVVILHHLCEEHLIDVEALPNGCETDGYTAHKLCTVCKKTFGKEIVPAHGHGEPEAMVVEGQATINQPVNLTFDVTGPMTITNNAEGWQGISVSANGEFLVYISAGESVELEVTAGVTYAFTSYYTGVPFTYTMSVMEVLTPGNCTEEGTLVWQCSICHQRVTENLGLNHQYAVEYYTAPGCETYGYLIESCVLCGDYNIERLNPTGHSARPNELPKEYDSYTDYWTGEEVFYVVRENPIEATCTKDGYYWWPCENCGEEQREVIPALGCDLVEVVVDATCVEYGYSFTYCSRSWSCDNEDENIRFTDKIYAVNEKNEVIYVISLDNYYFVQSSFIDLAGGKNSNNHNPEDKARGEVIDPTCTEPGLIIYWCTDCEAGIVEELPALGHAWGEEFTVEPTCDDPGYVAHICETCGEMEILEWVEFSSEYIYWTYESAAESHNLEGSVKEVFVPGVCGESYGLDRYLCADCGQYILVKDDSTINHVIPENLLGRDDPENVVEEIVVDPIVYTGTLTDENADVGDKVEFVMPCDGSVTISKNATAYLIISVLDVANGGYITIDSGEIWPAGTVFELNFWGWSAMDYEVILTVNPDVPMHQFAGKEATCTEAGYTAQWQCERCGHKEFSVELPATDHNIKIDVQAKAPTCDEVGYTEGYHCENCDLVVEAVEIPALGHNHVMTDHLFPEDRKPTDEYTYEHWECTVCGDEYIKNYVSYCVHEWNARPDRELSKEPTCLEAGYEAYTCMHCDTVMYVPLARLHHTNAAGQDLEYCGTETDDTTCASCKGTFAIPAHSFDAGVAYPPTCLTNAYIIYTCQVCDHYEVEDIEDTTGEHTWSNWAPVYDDNGVVVAEARGCQVCAKYETREVTCIAFSTTIENAANAEGTITDGSLVKVTVSVSGLDDLLWGFKLNVAYSANMQFVKANFVTDVFDYAQVATNHDGYVTILANADGEVELDSREGIVELYFRVTAPEIDTISVAVTASETLNGAGKPVDAVSYGADATTVLLMDVDTDGVVTLADALAAYNLIVANGYDACIDLDKDGFVTLYDYLMLFDFLSGAKLYEDIVALG